MVAPQPERAVEHLQAIGELALGITKLTERRGSWVAVIETRSVGAVDCDGERRADLPHPRISKSTDAFDEERNRHALH